MAIGYRLQGGAGITVQLFPQRLNEVTNPREICYVLPTNQYTAVATSRSSILSIKYESLSFQEKPSTAWTRWDESSALSGNESTSRQRHPSLVLLPGRGSKPTGRAQDTGHRTQDTGHRTCSSDHCGRPTCQTRPGLLCGRDAVEWEESYEVPPAGISAEDGGHRYVAAEAPPSGSPWGSPWAFHCVCLPPVYMTPDVMS